MINRPATVFGVSLSGEALDDFAAVAQAVQMAERGGADFVLLPDVAAVDETAPSFGHEAFALAAALSTVTTRIGLVVTASLDFLDPYNLARALGTIDHLTGGRAGWCAVTGTSDAEARNFGLPSIEPAAQRARRAMEMLGLVRALLDSWDDGAVARDKASGIFFARAGMRPPEHAGEFFTVRGPLDVPTSPQRQLPLFARSAGILPAADVACVADGGAPASPSSCVLSEIAADGSPDDLAERVRTIGSDGVILHGPAAAMAGEIEARLREAGLRGLADAPTLRGRLGLPRAVSRHAA